jgi:hypothetical protein
VKRFLINLEEDPSDKEDIKKAFELSLKLVNEYELSTVILLVQTLENIKDADIGEFLGEKRANNLLKYRSIQFKDFKLNLETLRSFSTSNASKSILIAVHATEKMFDKLNDVKNAGAIIVVPWTMDQTEKWSKTWGPELI